MMASGRCYLGEISETLLRYLYGPNSVGANRIWHFCAVKVAPMVRTLSGISATAPRHHVISWGEQRYHGISVFCFWLSPMVRHKAGISAAPAWHHVIDLGGAVALAFLRNTNGPL